MKKIAIFASGSGSNAENIINYFKNDTENVVKIVFCNKPDAYVLERAKRLNVPTFVFGREEFFHSDLVLNELKRLDIDNDRRRAIAKSYLKNISNPEIILPIVRDWESNVFYVFPIRCKYRNELQKYLRTQNIETLIHYPIPPHKQGAYKEWNNKSYSITEQIHDEILSLPVSQVMTDEEVEVVMNTINKFR